MAIRLRRVQGELVALCAARSVPQEGDIYLDDEVHQALSAKFARDFNTMYDLHIPHNGTDSLIEQEESINPNRKWWDSVYLFPPAPSHP